MKVCNKCKLSKPLEDFYKDKTHRDGRRTRCKGCLTKYPPKIIHIGMAGCSLCHVEKPLEAFTNDASHKNGKRSSCKSCNNDPPKPIPKEGMKFCSKCGLEKPFAAFYKSKKQSTGYRPSCKDCNLIEERQQRQKRTPEQKEKERIFVREWRLRPENIDYSRNYRQREEVKVKDKARRETEEAKAAAREGTRKYRATEKGISNIREYREREEVKLIIRWRKLVTHAFNAISTKKSMASAEFLGYTPKQLGKHLEQFYGKRCKGGMGCKGILITKENSETDHLLPLDIATKIYPRKRRKILTSFQKEHLITTIRELSQLHNLRRICVSCNIKKRNKLIWNKREKARVLAFKYEPLPLAEQML
jgi:hypothetical protein